MKISRAFSQPTGDTFKMKPVADLLTRYWNVDFISVDPFARASKLATFTNDFDIAQPTQYHLDALDFALGLLLIAPAINLVLFDPPYSYRQVRELYAASKRAWTQHDQQQVGRWSKVKDALTAATAPNAIVISFGWNTTGFGKSRGFTPIEYLVIGHGSAHND